VFLPPKRQRVAFPVGKQRRLPIFSFFENPTTISGFSVAKTYNWGPLFNFSPRRKALVSDFLSPTKPLLDSGGSSHINFP